MHLLWFGSPGSMNLGSTHWVHLLPFVGADDEWARKSLPQICWGETLGFNDCHHQLVSSKLKGELGQMSLVLSLKLRRCYKKMNQATFNSSWDLQPTNSTWNANQIFKGEWFVPINFKLPMFEHFIFLEWLIFPDLNHQIVKKFLLNDGFKLFWYFTNIPG